MKLFPLTLFVVLIFATNSTSAQINVPKPELQVFGMIGNHFTTKFLVDSGSRNLVGPKTTRAWGVGANLDFNFKKVIVRTGLYANIQMITESGFGVTGSAPVPNGVDIDHNRYIYFNGDVDRLHMGIPLNIKFTIIEKHKWKVSTVGGPYINFYFKMYRQFKSFKNVYLNSNGNAVYITQFETERPANKGDRIKPFYISTPKLEWELMLEAERKLKHKGAIILGLKAHLGTKNLETAYFTIWPNEPAYRSKGHYSLNRSYVGIYAGYRFGKNK